MIFMVYVLTHQHQQTRLPHTGTIHMVWTVFCKPLHIRLPYIAHHDPVCKHHLNIEMNRYGKAL